MKPVTTEARANRRKVLVGTVISDKMQKTVVVQVATTKMHPIYKKRVRRVKKYKVHDPEGKGKIGDIVRIIETRPISATKYFRLLEVTTSVPKPKARKAVVRKTDATKTAAKKKAVAKKPRKKG